MRFPMRLLPFGLFTVIVLLLAQQPLARTLKADYQSQGSRSSESASASGSGCTLAPDGLVAWYDASSTTVNNMITANDLRGGNNATTTSVEYAQGEVGTGFSFAGNGYVEASSTFSNAFLRQLTIDAWINPSAVDGSRRIVDKITPSAADGYVLQIVDGHLNFIVGDANLMSAATIATGKWTHVAGVYDGSQASIYIDGVADANTAQGSGIPSNSLTLRIGADPNGQHGFSGLIDEVEIFNRGLSPAEVSATYNAGSAGNCKPTCVQPPFGMVGWWAGDGDATDTSDAETNNNGTLENGAGFALGKVGQSFSLNGSGADVLIPDGPGLNPTAALTLDAWVFPKADGGPGDVVSVILNKETDPNNGNLIQYEIARKNANVCTSGGGIPTGNFAFFLGGLSGLPNDCIGWVDGGGQLPLNTWSHVALTYDGASINAYVNGALTRQVAVSGTLPVTSGALRIGARVQLNSVWNGLIDEAELFNRGLSGIEVASIYNAGLAGNCKQTVIFGETAQVGDATVHFSGGAEGSSLTEIPVDPNWLGPLPSGYTNTGLAYDLTTDFTAFPAVVCFHVPSFTDPNVFARLAILHDDGTGPMPVVTYRNDATATICGQVSSFSPFVIANGPAPTAAPAKISGRVAMPDGRPLAGVVVQLSGSRTARTWTDSRGLYSFEGVETEGFYTVAPQLASYSFSPRQLSFSLLRDKTDAVFTATPDMAATTSPLEMTEYFVRQQYVDFLGREPDAGGLAYWTSEIARCGEDEACLRRRRVDVAAAFFIEREYQRTGSFVYRLYKAGIGRRLSYAEFDADRAQLVDGANLEARQAAFAEAFVQRPEFIERYGASTTAESFADALISTVREASGVDLSAQRAALIARYNEGTDINRSRSLALREAIEATSFRQAEYNPSFVLMEYFGYLRRDPDEGGYKFWLNVLNNREPGNFRGMVCSFITSAEYQSRFGSVILHSNSECGQ